jgi:hypothetical protein
LHPLVSFAIKTAIVALALTGSLTILINVVVSDLGELIDQRIVKLHTELGTVGSSGRAFWTNVGHALDRAADPKNEIAPERQQQLLEDIRILGERARPFILEVMTMLSPQSPTTGAAKEK